MYFSDSVDDDDTGNNVDAENTDNNVDDNDTDDNVDDDLKFARNCNIVIKRFVGGDNKMSWMEAPAEGPAADVGLN